MATYNDIEISDFKFYKNYSLVDGVIEGEENHVYLDYTTVEVFVSRACGFINNYIDLSFLIMTLMYLELQQLLM